MTANGGGTIGNIAQWGCLIALGAIIVGLLLGAGWMLTRDPAPPTGVLPTAILWTATPTPTATLTPTPLSITPAPSAAGIDIGTRVRVIGTGEIGLSLRTGPSTANERLYVAPEGEIFIVAGGPEETDELTWWLLRSETDPQREGWAAGTYLEEIP